MHELSLALGILEISEEEAERHGGARVEAIHLGVGALAGVVKEALLSAWELACEQTPFERSRLVIEEIPIVILCAVCQAERPVRSVQWMCCAECGTPATEVLRGREMLVTLLELSE